MPDCFLGWLQTMAEWMQPLWLRCQRSHRPWFYCQNNLLDIPAQAIWQLSLSGRLSVSRLGALNSGLRQGFHRPDCLVAPSGVVLENYIGNSSFSLNRFFLFRSAEQDSSLSEWQQMALLNKSRWNSSVWLGVGLSQSCFGRCPVVGIWLKSPANSNWRSEMAKVSISCKTMYLLQYLKKNIYYCIFIQVA